ncbi:ABC transporter permease [Nocardia macrotermitis]|uniref:Putative D,D-dipeptide transport system permease protein DdpC n=1 Tax=Nocardia macrotermitis TaxID=2585198 RepID=A0A7K0D795_9NOCA|nr:ABC transporter permease [Nocardia macrotermitis]MQY21431.1 putative D,D-dipeptide transport system permease protein DdpC [Nocardia macrotermitis]
MTTLRRLFSIPSARVCLVILAAVVLLAIFGEALAPYDALRQSPQILQGPSGAHLLGTDYVGRDVLSRLMAGTRLSVLGALEVIVVGMALGVPTGLASVWAGRAGEWFALRLSETLTVLPFTVFTIAVAATLGNGMNQAMIAVGILSAPTFFRISRAVALGLRTTQYVESAELMGASTWWILRTHMWSKVLPNVAVAAAQACGAALLIIASLAFLGVGVTPPTPTWGGMLASDLGYLELQPWAPLFPGVLMMLTVGALNILADCLREAGSDAPRARRGLLPRLLGRSPSIRAAANPALPSKELDRVTA